MNTTGFSNGADPNYTATGSCPDGSITKRYDNILGKGKTGDEEKEQTILTNIKKTLVDITTDFVKASREIGINITDFSV